MIRYKIKLSLEEVTYLRSIVNKGSHTTQTYRSAYILLNCDEGEYSEKVSNEQICQVLKISMRTIDRVKKKFIEQGMEFALERTPSSREYVPKIDGDLEAKLVQLCCSDPPHGRAKWSLRLLSDKLVELQYIDSISYVTVRKILKKMNLSLGE